MRSHSLLMVFLVVLAFFVNTTLAQQVNPQTTQPSITVHPTVIRTGTFLGISPKLRDIKPVKKTGGIIGKNQVSAERDQEQEIEFNSGLAERNYPYAATAQPQGPDPVWQRHTGTNHVGTRAPILNFAGQSSPYMPSDCNGSVGINYFMQGVNSTYAIYDKNTGTQVIAPTAFNTLFSGVTGSSNNDGDIIVLFDDNAQRWFASEFDISDANNMQMIAVSVTSDPTGSWYRWSFDVDDLPDYPKFGVWQDGYYMSDNNSGNNDVYVFERSVMLTGGASPQMVAFSNPNRPNSGFHCIEPLDNDGQWAPSGTPGQFITINDDAWGGGGDELWIYQCHVDWATPSNSTFARTQTITVPAFDSNFGTGWDNITQPGTTQKVDAIPQILMFRAQYRNFGTTQTIVCAHTVDVDGTDHAGIRWYELQNTGSGWTIRQNGTYAPDGDSRWLPSITMDSQRNISVAYNVSSSTTYPSIRYAAQSAAENANASGVLDIPEENIKVGTQSQTTANRWGDYAEMSIDPVDDVTFWFTTEYYNSGKKTQIADWRFGVAPLPPNTNFVINTPNTLLRPVPLLTGQSATFTNLTTGQVDNWLWTFPGGTPGSSTAQDPGTITYNTAGLYDVSLYADNVYGDSTLTRTDYIKVIDPTVVTCDTLVQFYGNPVVYRSSGGGYVGGTNEYGCSAIAEKFDNFSPYNKITGGRFYWAQATSGTNPNVTFVLWGDDGSGAPGAQLATKVVPLTDIVNDMATLGYTDIAFAADVPLPSSGAFFLGFEMPGDAASGDTLAVVTNTDSDGPDDTGYSLYTGWETYSAWSMSLMNAIFAYGCYDPYMPPIADFEGTPTTVNAGNTVTFTDLSYGGTPTSWSWSFAGGTPNSSTAQNPTITYNTPGYYDVKLVVSNAYGSDSITKTNYIHVVDPNSCSCGGLSNVVGNQVLYNLYPGYVTGNNSYGDEAKAEYFDSYAPYTEINGAYLHFGYAYVNDPSTNITINIWDNTGTGGSPGTIIATTTLPITTIANDVANGDSTYVSFPAVGIPGPFYIGFMIPNPAGAGDTVALMSGLYNSGATNTGWEIYNGAWEDMTAWGGYNWNLAVFPVVCTTGAPLVDFTVNNTLVAAGNTLDFTDLSTCGPTSWSWNFGGGGTPNTSTTQNPSITFNTPGIYDVSLTASNGSGSNTELKTSYITVLEPIVWWDFPNNPDDNTADGGIAVNLTKTIDVFGGATLVGFGSAGASTNSADGNNWGTGAGVKGWQIDFTTTGYASLLLYSKQNSDARGPQDWKVQYSLDGSTWTDVPNTTITCATDWTTGVLNGISLPVACENQPTVYLRWIMTTNTGVGGTILSTRDNFIDDIMVAGVAIGSPPVADFSADVTSVCEGGTVTFTDLSTNSPTSWSWDFGDATNSTQQNPSHVYSTAGIYTVVLTATNSAGSDVMTKTNYITVNPNPTVSTSVTDVSCNGGNDGDATATPAGGTAPYGYSWNTGGTTTTISGLIAGTYTVTVTDANTCSGTGSATVSQPATALSANITASTNVSCNGGSDGSATVTASGGTTPYTYAWPSGGTGSTETGLSAGSYIVTVTDANNCTATATANISEPATALSTTISGNNISCNGGSDGDATVTASGGTSPYSYSWTGGQNTASISGLVAGTYGCTITDVNGCTSTESITLTEPPTALTTSITGTNISCNGGNDGTATVTASGGTSPYFYLWTGGQNTASISGLIAGTYGCTITDVNGCTSTESITLTEPPTGVSSTISSTNVSCNGGSDGTATVTASGGTSPYFYSWTGGQTSTSISGLTTGTYSVTVTDANGCTSISSTNITEPTALTTSISGTDVSCNGGSDGTASVTASGGTSPYTYLWTGGQATVSITGLSAGSYSCTITDNNGCTSVETYVVTEPTTLTTTISGTDATCNGAADGSATVTPTGGTSPYTYVWSSGGTSATETGLIAGNYTVTVTDANGCTATDNTTINEPSAIVITETHNDATCGSANGDATVTVSGGSSPYTYSWSSGQTTPSISGLASGNYTVTVTDANFCTNTLTVSISSIGGPTITTASTDVSCNGGNDGTATVTASGGTSPYTYAWSSGGNGATETGLIAGNYTVTVTDASSCSASASVTVNEPSILTATSVISDVNCNGGNDGSIALTVSGGTSPYTYAWSSGGNGATESGLTAGTYDVTVTDANSCTYTNSYTVNEPTALTVTSSTVDALCNGSSDGSATVSVSGGTSPYTYAWSSGGNGATESGLTAGNYTCTITDANACIITESITINEPSAMILTMNSTDASCGLANGSADVSVTGGNSPYTYLWSNGATTSSISSLGAGTYTVTVTDANSCQDNNSVTINQTSAVTATASISDVNCNGGNDGSIALIVSGGTSPYTYAWSSGGNSATESGLTAGTYDVTVTDANSCTYTNSYTVNEPTALTVTSSTVDALCNGSSDGSATVSVSGGTSPYTYAWSSGGNGATESGLTAGNYTCTITDANACTVNENVTINEPVAMVLTMNSTDASCGSSNGTADVSVTGGNSPYVYLWSNGATTPSISSLSAGSYSITVTDANSCQETSSVIVNNIGGPTLTVSTSDVSCNGGTDGSATVSATGGTSPYTYIWSSGGTGTTETGLGAGNYTVTVTDANSCSSTANATINEPAAISVTGTVTDATCNGCTDGIIDVTVSGGTSPYTYAWSSGGSGSTETGLAAGTYTVTVTDDNSCTDIETYIVNEPSSLTITIVSTTDVSCNGGSDGSVTISVSGGVAPYTYAWSSGGVGTTETGLSAGTYTVTVTDANSVTGLQTVTINEPLAIAITFTANDANCGATDGSADVSVTGGTSPYTYLWSNGSTTSTANNLSAGTYYLTVTDSALCQTVDSVVIGNIGGPTLTVTGTDVSCYGLSDGTATVVATGGSTPYTYNWSSGGTADTETGLGAGIFTVTVTDAGGCISSESITINEPTQIVVTDSIVDVSCSGNADGAIYLTVTGGNSPYSFAWSNGGTGQSETGLIGGTYSVTITDNNSCTDIETYTISESGGLTLSLVSSTDVTCNGGNNGSATVSVTGGTTPVTYMWTNGATTATAFNLSAGTYTVTATDANNCTATLDVTISEPTAMTVNVTTNNAHCGNSDGSITVAITGGTTPYIYLWSNGATSDSLSDLAMGIYIVTITDANGCEYVSTNIVNNLDAPTVMVAGTDVACFGGDDGTATAMVTGGTIPYSYLWSSGGTASIENGLTAGNYIVTVTDANNCSSIGTFRIEQPAFGIKISSSVTDAGCPEKTDGAIDLDVEFGTPPYNFAWSSGENYEDLTDIATGSYIITVTDMHNCSLTDSIFVGTKQSTCLHVYNTITPNGDGKNDTWVIDGIIYYPNCAVKVFNQWGNMVYSSTGYPENWDGTNNGHPLPAATYYYIIDLGNGDDPITGDLTIIRSTGNRMPMVPNYIKKKSNDKKTGNQDSVENLINE